MKATGIVRRIDDLGRVVIPKEIRRTMRIREGDPLEIFTNRDGEVIFKKYSPIGELGEFAMQYAESLAKTSNLPACITDRDTVIAVSGASKREILEKPVSAELERLMSSKTSYTKAVGTSKLVPLMDGNDKHYASVVCPIIADGDTIGSVVFFSDEKAISSESDEKLAQAAAGFFARHMEG
ncbi:MAG: stage V sporulation protein T [Clostridia bacterium]|nr:stage V sporulation protein T [Clostridia bacterium]